MKDDNGLGSVIPVSIAVGKSLANCESPKGILTLYLVALER